MRARLVLQIDRYPSVDSTMMNLLENDLHVECLEGCPNRELLGALRRTHCVLTLSKHVLGTEMPIPAADPFLVEHLEVVDSLLADDLHRASESLSRHIAAATPKVIERLATFRAEFEPPSFPLFKTLACA